MRLMNKPMYQLCFLLAVVAGFAFAARWNLRPRHEPLTFEPPVCPLCEGSGHASVTVTSEVISEQELLNDGATEVPK